MPEELKTIYERIRRLQAVQVRVLKILGFIFHNQRNLCHLNLLVYCCKIPLFKGQFRNVVEIFKIATCVNSVNTAQIGDLICNVLMTSFTSKVNA